MSDDSETEGATGPPPSAEDIAALKRLVGGIIRSQGNRFIKELLRSKKIKIGATKDDFERNLNEAVDRGELRLADFDGWLQEVEGWGNQHVYLYRLGDGLAKALTETKIKNRVVKAGLEDVWNAPTVTAFPEEATLTSIAVVDGVLRLTWQEATSSWARASDKDYREEDGLDIIEYRAWRMVEQRAITRFEARPALGLAGLFIAAPVAGEEHELARTAAFDVVSQLISLPELQAGQLDISVMCRNLDQRSVPTNVGAPTNIKTQRSRLTSGGAHVEFAASSLERAYWEEDAIRSVRRSIGNQQLGSFQGSDGVFAFQPGSAGGGIDRQLRVQLYGRGDRIRLWAQMQVDEAWAILTELSKYA